MRKSYIGWWVASAWCFFGCCKFIYELIFFPGQSNDSGIPVLSVALVLALLFFYLGYRRFKEFQEYQEDRKIRNEFYKSNTNKNHEDT